MSATVSDSAGNTYDIDQSGNIGSNPVIFVASAKDAKPLPNGGTVTVTVQLGGGMSVTVEEWAGINAVDATHGHTNSFPFNLTTLNANATIFADISASAVTGSPSLSAGAGFTAATGGPTFTASTIYAALGESENVTTAQAYSVAGTFGGSSFGDIVAVSYYAVNPGTPAAPTLTQDIALTQVIASWPATTHTASYTVQRSTTSAVAGFSNIATGLTSPTYTDTSPPAGNVWYRVQSVNGIATVTGTATAWAAPATTGAPTLTAVQVPLGVTVAWTPVSELGYQSVQRSPDNATWSTIVTNLSGSTASYTDASVLTNTLYYYRIVATNDVGSSNGTSASITSAQPLMVITYTETYNPAAVNLSWQALSGATGYVPQRSTNNSSWSNLSASLVGTSYIDSSVSPGVLYYYRIQGTSGAGTFYSPVVGVYAPGPAIPAAPTLAINPYFPQGVDVWWAPVVSMNPPTYSVQRSVHSANAWTTLASGIYGTFYEDEGVPFAGSWDYRILVTDVPPGTAVTGYSNTGATATIAVNVLPPAAPLLVSPPGSLTVSANWPQVGSAATYTLQRSADACQTWATVASGLTALSYTDSGLTAYSRYWYRVQAVNGGNTATGPPRSVFVDGNAAPPAGYRLILGGVDQSAKMTLTEPKLDRQVAGQGANLSLRLHFEPGPNTVSAWEPAVLLNGQQVLHQGWVNDYVRISTNPVVEDVTMTAPDAVALCLNTTYVTESFEQQTLGFILRQLLARNVPGLTVANVQSGPVIPYLALQGESLLSAIRKLLSQSAAAVQQPFFRVAADLDVRLTMGSGSLPTAPFQLSDASPITGGYPS